MTTQTTTFQPDASGDISYNRETRDFDVNFGGSEYIGSCKTFVEALTLWTQQHSRWLREQAKQPSDRFCNACENVATKQFDTFYFCDDCYTRFIDRPAVDENKFDEDDANRFSVPGAELIWDCINETYHIRIGDEGEYVGSRTNLAAAQSHARLMIAERTKQEDLWVCGCGQPAIFYPSPKYFPHYYLCDKHMTEWDRGYHNFCCRNCKDPHHIQQCPHIKSLLFWPEQATPEPIYLDEPHCTCPEVIKTGRSIHYCYAYRCLIAYYEGQMLPLRLGSYSEAEKWLDKYERIWLKRLLRLEERPLLLAA